MNKLIAVNLQTKSIMNTDVINNYSKLKASSFLPLFLLIAIILSLYSQDALQAHGYVQVQKKSFFYINHYLGQYPNIEYNLTQLGDASVLLSFLTLFIVYAPKIWEALLSASLVSLVFSRILKTIFFVPRPSVAFDDNSFVIVGKKVAGFASMPSGHSITIFTTLTVLLFAFMPKKLGYKVLWSLSLVIIGIIIAFTRVAVGAHHPLDVVIGSIIGYIAGVTGILISRKYKIWAWIGNKKFYPVFMALILGCGVSLISKIINENLIVIYFALASSFVSLYMIIYVYAKK